MDLAASTLPGRFDPAGYPFNRVRLVVVQSCETPESTITSWIAARRVHLHRHRRHGRDFGRCAQGSPGLAGWDLQYRPHRKEVRIDVRVGFLHRFEGYAVPQG